MLGKTSICLLQSYRWNSISYSGIQLWTFNMSRWCQRTNCHRWITFFQNSIFIWHKFPKTFDAFLANAKIINLNVEKKSWFWARIWTFFWRQIWFNYGSFFCPYLWLIIKSGFIHKCFLFKSRLYWFTYRITSAIKLKLIFVLTGLKNWIDCFE